MIFVDASAIVAMIAREPEALPLSARIDWESDITTSAIAVWEAVRAVARVRGVEIAEARMLVTDFLRDARIRIVPIGAEEAEWAIEAHQRYGKGVHVAALNMGDCFAYACARQYGAAILFKGEDFIHTDLKDALLA